MADMKDVINTVTTVDIQMLDANRENATLIKLDNPKNDITREQVSNAMQTAFANEWFLCSKGGIAKYLGDVIVNQSIKRTLEGADYYVTPSQLTLSYSGESDMVPDGTIEVSGATIQGYNFPSYDSRVIIPTGIIQNNGLRISISVKPGAQQDQSQRPPAYNFNIALVINGEVTTVPVTVPAP